MKRKYLHHRYENVLNIKELMLCFLSLNICLSVSTTCIVNMKCIRIRQQARARAYRCLLILLPILSGNRFKITKVSQVITNFEFIETRKRRNLKQMKAIGCIFKGDYSGTKIFFSFYI